MTRAFALAALMLAAAPPLAAETTLHILHINDLHSRLEPVNRFNSTCAPEDDEAGDCFGGIARVAAEIERRRAEIGDAPVLVLDAGDQFQGSLMYTAYKGAAEAEFMEKIGFDAMVVGNHEFDDGPGALARFAEKVSFPVVAGNLDLRAEPRLSSQIADIVVLETGGLRVGIVSALATSTVDTSSPGPNVRFLDEIEALRADVAALEAQGITHIIALTHVGITADRRIAAAVPGIDAIVGGHSHTLLSNGIEGAVGPYPLMVDGTPVVQAGAYSRALGHLTLTFDEAGDVIAAEGDTVLLDAAVKPNPWVAARVQSLAAPLDRLKAQVVGETAEPVDARGCRTGECPIGNLVADAMLAAAAPQGVAIALQIGGGLRASVDAGEVTMGEVLTVLPFQNTLSIFEVRGDVLVAALENGVSQVEETAGRFPQVAGLRFTWDPSVAAGEGRVVAVEVAEGDGFAPLDPQALYRVATNNYLRQGGDGYRMLAEVEGAYDYGPGLEDVVARYLAALEGPYIPYTDGRIARR